MYTFPSFFNASPMESGEAGEGNQFRHWGFLSQELQDIGWVPLHSSELCSAPQMLRKNLFQAFVIKNSGDLVIVWFRAFWLLQMIFV